MATVALISGSETQSSRAGVVLVSGELAEFDPPATDCTTK